MDLPLKDILLIKMNSYQYNKLVHIHHCFGSLTKTFVMPILSYLSCCLEHDPKMLLWL